MGENKPNLTALLSERLSYILGRSEEERSAIERFVRDVYFLRSNFVHGDLRLLKQRIDEERLKKLQATTRLTVVWFLHYLNQILDQQPVELGDRLPSRKELLEALDSNVDLGHGSSWIRSILPLDFPHVARWLDPAAAQKT